jgi:hypothetical protein
VTEVTLSVEGRARVVLGLPNSVPAPLPGSDIHLSFPPSAARLVPEDAVPAAFSHTG